MTPLLVRPSSGGGRDRGSMAVEMAILTPVLVGFLVVAFLVGRTAIAYNSITVAAHDAARAASISRAQGTATTRATEAATTTLADQGLDCDTVTVVADTSQFTRPVGQPAAVTVTVTCLLSFQDLGVPLTREVSATFVSPVDTWRGR